MCHITAGVSICGVVQTNTLLSYLVAQFILIVNWTLYLWNNWTTIDWKHSVASANEDGVELYTSPRLQQLRRAFFATAGPGVWESLPLQPRQQDVSFKRIKTLLKTFLFCTWNRGAMWLVVKSAVYINALVEYSPFTFMYSVPPVPQRIEFRLAVLVYRCLNSAVPTYLLMGYRLTVCGRH